MWFRKIKFKKQQFFLAFIIMFITTLIFTICLGFIITVNKYIGDYYNGSQNSDYYINTSYEEVKNSVEDWADKTDSVRSADTIEGYYLSSTIKVNDEKLDPNFIYIFPVSNVNDLNWRMDFVKDSKNEDKPAENEIWISNVFADLHDVSVGDKITLLVSEKKEYTISAIVNNAVCPSATLGIDYFYLNQTDVDKLTEFQKQYFISVKNVSFQDYTDNYNDLVDEIGSNIGGVIFTKSLLIQIATMISNIIGGIGLFATFVILIGAILIIRFILKSNLFKEYKSIGIYKSFGYSSHEIRMIYVKCFGSVVVIATILGAIVGNIIANKIAESVLCFVGNYNGSVFAFVISSIITIMVLNLITLINLYLVTRNIKKISPVDAIRASVEASSGSYKGKKSIKNASNIFTLSINDILKNRKSSILMLIILTMSFYLLILFININYSITEIKNNSNIWFGTPECTATISGDFYNGSEENQLLDQLDNNSSVDKYIYGEMTSIAGVVLDSQKYSLSNTNIGVTIFNSYQDNGFIVKSGKNPEKSDEIAVSETILKEAGLALGDKITLKINDEDKQFEICGTYVTQLNLGYNFRILIDALGNTKDSYREGEIYVSLNDGSSFHEFKEQIEDENYGVSVEKIIPATKDTIYTIQQIVNPVIAILVIAFVAFALLNIINLIIMFNLDNRKNYGIMKALGFTTRYICIRNLIKIMLISAVSAVLAFILNTVASGSAFQLAVGGIDGLLFNMSYSMKIIGATLIMIVLTICLCCISIVKITPKELMEE